MNDLLKWQSSCTISFFNPIEAARLDYTKSIKNRAAYGPKYIDSEDEER
jgi:hypothetical protein